MLAIDANISRGGQIRDPPEQPMDHCTFEAQHTVHQFLGGGQIRRPPGSGLEALAHS